MYEYKELYTLDFSDVEHYLQMHFIIRDALDFPDDYGCNWDAFWDCLTDMYGEPVHMELRGLDVLASKFGEDEVETLLRILKRFKHYSNDSFSDEITIEIVSENGRRLLE